jgi:hypothetical protein
MLIVDVNIGPNVDFTRVEPLVDEVCHVAGLQITLKTTQASYPGSIHWRLKQGRERGTLELTAWPSQRRVWFKLQNGRAGAWIQAAIAQLKPHLEETLSHCADCSISDVE